MPEVTVPIERLPHGADLPLPGYASDGAAGLDLLAAVDATLRLEPMGRALVPTGIRLALPEGLEAQIRPRSGLALRHGVTVLNAPGTIDADYRGEIAVILINLGPVSFAIERGARIAQLVVAPVLRAAWAERSVDAGATRGATGGSARRAERRCDRGAGSTGRRFERMLRPSKKLALALEAVVDIAFHGGSEPVQSQDIARRLGLPRRYLEQVMQQLVRAGVLKGVRGPRGGYRLARERRRISVGEVVRVVQGLEEPVGRRRAAVGIRTRHPGDRAVLGGDRGRPDESAGWRVDRGSLPRG